MENSNLIKKLEDLEKRVAKLESLKKANLSMFGRSYSLVGNADSDFLIKTKGQVKILWGSKFIDLIKDGKINVDAKFIYREQLVGTKDGIYITGGGENMEVWLVAGGQKLNLVGEVGNTYISFLAPLETTSDLKYLALENIGLFYKNFEAIENDGLKNGIIYVESEKKLYTILDGILSEFTINFPNPFTEQFVVAKATDNKGAILIKGRGISNSLAFDNLYIYTEGEQAVIDSENNINVKVLDKSVMSVTSTFVEFLTRTVSSTFLSRDANNNYGFRLYMDNGVSILEVDKLIVRQGSEELTVLYPQYWFGGSSIIKKIKAKADNPEMSSFSITLNLNSPLLNGDTLIVYLLETLETSFIDDLGNEYKDSVLSLVPIELTITSILSSLYTDSDGNLQTIVGTSLEVSSNIVLSTELANSLVGKYIFRVKSADGSFLPLKLKENSLDIIEYKADSDADKVRTRVGNLEQLEEELEGYGIYTDNLRVGGKSAENFPRYTNSLKAILDSLDIKETDSYDSVFTPVGILKSFFNDIIERIERLEERVSPIENDLTSMKDDIYTMLLDIETLKNLSALSI